MARRTGALIAIALALTLLTAGLTIAADPPDLASYLAEIRAAKMSEMARSSLSSVAGCLTGQTILQYRKDPDSGRYFASYTNTTCPNPKADPAETKKAQETYRQQVVAEINRLGPLADADRSGFVSTAEAFRFKSLVETGYLVAQAQADGCSDLKALVVACGIEADAVRSKLAAYGELAKSAAAAGIVGLPVLAPLK